MSTVVFRSGKIYSLTTKDEHGNQFSPIQLESAFQEILDLPCGKVSHNIAALTALKRDQWHDIRKSLDQTLLKKIEHARFCVTLETQNSESETSDIKNNQLGITPGNIWFDKSINHIIYPNGQSGANCEHSPADGAMSGRLFVWMAAVEKYQNNKVTELDTENKPYQKSSSQPEIKELLIDTSAVQSDIEKALTRIHHLKTHCHNRAIYLPYGKDWIKSAKFSPDGWFQMCLQLTFYQLKNYIPKLYESGVILTYRHGRTETIRSVSENSIKFCTDPNLKNLAAGIKDLNFFKKKVSLGQGIVN